MDLDALRKAALSSKKRKLAAATTSSSSNSLEKEEGEIDDEPQPTTTTTSSTFTIRTSPVHSPAAFFAIKEECKVIISQLLSYGIPPDYMLSIGVSREVLKIAFNELNLNTSLIPPSPNLSAQSTPFQPSNLSPRPLNGQDADPQQPPAMVDYEALEQEKRKKLFAKKAALKARNQRQAQNLESELESLFASSGPPLESTEAFEDEAENAIVASDSEPLAKRPRHSLANPEPTSSSQAEHLHSLRESIDHTEETAQPPPSGPFAYNPSFARANHSHQPSSSSTTNRRPVATDLEHLPSHRLSESALSRQRVIGGFGGSLFNGGFDVGESLIIEISDDEDDERIDMKDGEGDVRMSNGENQPRKEDSTSTPQRVPSPSDSRSIFPSIPANASSSSKAAQVGEILRQRQLEEKELEIKRIMDRIKDMESRKKRATSAVSEDVSVTSERVMNGAAASKQSTANGARQVDSQSATSTHPSNTLDSASAPTPSPPVLVTSSSSVDPVYRPYNSTLSRYPLLGGRPSTSLSIPFYPSPLSTSDFSSTNASSTEGTADFVSDVGSAGLSTFVAHKHKLDPARKWCKAESLGGVCRDGTCKSVHERDFVAREEDKAEYLLQQHTSTST